MGNLSQAGRMGMLKTPLGDDTLVLSSFSGAEGLGELFEFQVDALSEQENINFDDALGRACTVTTVIPKSRCSVSAATPSGGIFNSCQFRISRYFAPCCAVDAAVSVTTRINVSAVNVMVPSKGMCSGVTPSGPPGKTNPSMRSATA